MDGLLNGAGFTYFLKSSYAEVRPQNGLIVIVGLDARSPLEEVHHQSVITMNSLLVFNALRHEWGECAVDPVSVWRPFVEALGDIYTGAQPVEGVGFDEEIREAHIAFETAVMNDIRSWNSDIPTGDLQNVDEDSNGDSGSEKADSNISEQLETDIGHAITSVENPQEQMARKLSKIISSYLEQDLLYQDMLRVDILKPDVLEQTTKPLLEKALPILKERYDSHEFPPTAEIDSTSRLIEIYILFELIEQNPSFILKRKDKIWQEICTILDRWETEINNGQSPFQIMEITPNEILESNAAIVTCELAALLGEIMFTRSFPEQYLVRSLPAVFHMFHPLITGGVQPVPLPSSIYPRVVLKKDKVAGYLAEPSETTDRERLLSASDHHHPECWLYGTDLDRWVGPEQHRNPFAYTHHMALQVFDCLRRLEMLWQNRDDDIECFHCQLLIGNIRMRKQVAQGTPGGKLGSRLEQNAFTHSGLDPLLNTAKCYPQWLNHQIVATYNNHPALPDPSTANL